MINYKGLILKKVKRFTVSSSAAAAFIALGLVASAAVAQGSYFMEWNKSIRRLGAQANYFYVDFNEPFGQSCAHGIAQIHGADRKGLYTQLLAAKVSGKRISRIDYSQPNGNGTDCIVELVEIIE